MRRAAPTASATRASAPRSGVERIAAAFAGAKADRRLALVAYLMAGDPDLATSGRLARAAVDAGADILELGVPFSDPLADGATIQRAGERALASGTTLAATLTLGGAIARERGVPVLLMGYTNPFARHGTDRLVSELRDGGLAGLIVPDLPAEEAAPLEEATARAGLARISLFAPTTPDGRLARLVPDARGFVYCVSLTGVTGARAALADDVAAFVARVRAHARVPVVVGFGISRPEHVRALRGVADGVVVGSALVDAAARGEAALGSLVRELREACA